MKVIISTKSPEYIKARNALKSGKFNGAYYYAREIEEIMLPLLKTDRNVFTIHVPNIGIDNALIWAHSNIQLESVYNHWHKYKDLVFIVSQKQTYDKLICLFPNDKIIYLPLSIDFSYLDKFKYMGQRKGSVYFGNVWAERHSIFEKIPKSVNRLHDVPRKRGLEIIARAETVYACGRCYLESLYLNPKGTIHVKPDYATDDLVLIDTHEAVKLLQKELDKIENI